MNTAEKQILDAFLDIFRPMMSDEEIERITKETKGTSDMHVADSITEEINDNSKQ